MRYCGREFSEHEVQWIRQQIGGSSNRRAISIGFCEQWGWHKPDGGLKEMSCRVALLKMHREGLITLPPAQRRANLAHKHTKRSMFTGERPPIHKKAGAFDLHLEMVEKGTLKLWNEFIDRYHYLGYTPLAGAQVRYFVKEHDEPLALLGFSAAAWKTAPRDAFIGWDAESRTQNLHLVVQNSRFLVLPWVRSKNLASRILSIAAKRLPHDWQSRYGYRPVLLETFVEKARFEGTCYKAANWTYLGDTQGRGKLDIHCERKKPVKAVWVYPLTGAFRRHLGETQ
jgi:Druantia protein DruA